MFLFLQVPHLAFSIVTPRTAGFNTVDIGLLTNASILLLIILMFWSLSRLDGGGVKTTSAAILGLVIWSRLKGNEDVNVFNRTIPREVIGRRSHHLCFRFFGSFHLVRSPGCGGGDLPLIESRRLFVEYLFDTVSAFGTVGLSMGITPKLNDLQKYALIVMMFAGRVGPLTLAFSLSRRKEKAGVTYAEEGVMVG